MTRKNPKSTYDLKKWRAAMKLTQAQAAKKLGYTANYYRELEWGNRNPSPLLEPACQYYLLEKTGNIKKFLRGVF